MAILMGTPRADRISGGGDDDRILGLGGNDSIDGAGGRDRIDGGEGDDYVVGGLQGDVLTGGPGNDSLSATQYFIDYFNDDENYNFFSLYDGEIDLLDGGAGDDIVYMSIGDRAVGGVGIDTVMIRFDGASEREIWVLSAERKIFANGAVVEGFERIHLQAGAGYDRIMGGVLDDVIWGGDGDDILRGNDGNDRLWGELGNDVLIGGEGDDYLNDGPQGNSDVEVMNDQGGDDILRGGAGDDTFVSESGADLLAGGDGDDFFIIATADVGEPQPSEPAEARGGSGTDVVTFSYFLGGSSMVLNLTDQRGNAGAADGWTFKAMESFQGSFLDDRMRGGAGVDRFDGWDGDDLLIGGRGADVVTGGEGRDSFALSVFSGLRRGQADRITDFTRGDDKLRVNASNFGFPDAEEVRVHNGSGTVSPAGQPAFVFQPESHRLWLVPEGGGPRSGWTHVATIDSVGLLSAADFLFL